MSYDRMGAKDGYIARFTGARIEPEAESAIGLACHGCGATVQTVYSLADVGVFCSAACRAKATRPALTVRCRDCKRRVIEDRAVEVHCTGDGHSTYVCRICLDEQREAAGF